MIRVLGIETSCDETAAAVVALDADGRPQILSNIVLSQIEEHAAFGGVVPEIAARAHVEALDGIIEAALADAGVALADVDAIAATAGPGLVGGLIVGLMTAKALAAASGKPLQAINHLEGHALTARLTDGLAFPYLLLLVSGGHTQVVLVRGVGGYERWGTTIDDALGEAFDKTAKLIGLPYPGGPNVEKAARDGDRKRFDFPRPLKGEARLDFSFSGLKTAVRQAATAIAPLSDKDVADICASFQAAIADTLDDRVGRSLARFRGEFPDIARPSLVVAGGVAANAEIRRTLEDLCHASWLRLRGAADGAVHRQCRNDRLGWPRTIARRHDRHRRHALRAALALAARRGSAAAGRLRPARGKSMIRRHARGSPCWAAAPGARRWPSPCGGPDMRSGLWARDAATDRCHPRAIDENTRYLPGISIDPAIVATERRRRGAATARPMCWRRCRRSNCARALAAVARLFPPDATIILCAKGIERSSGKLLSSIVEELLPGHPVAALSGPSFATDVARGLPTAVVIAASRQDARGRRPRRCGFRPSSSAAIRPTISSASRLAAR